MCIFPSDRDFFIIIIIFFFPPCKISYSVAILATEAWVQLSQVEKPKCYKVELKYSERNNYIPSIIVRLVPMVSPDVSGGDL